MIDRFLRLLNLVKTRLNNDGIYDALLHQAKGGICCLVVFDLLR